MLCSVGSATLSRRPQNRLQAFLLLIPLDLFALLRSRSTGGELLSDIRPVSYDAVHHRGGQAWRARP